LGAKHNAALAELCSRDVDCVVIVGSDDLLSRSYFEYVRDAYRKGCRALKVDGCYYYDAATDNTWFYKKVDCGAGRMLSYDLCRQRGFKAWPDDRERYLDGSMQHQIFQYAAPWRIKHQPEQGICVLDIKAGFNMHSLREMKDLQLESNRKLVDTEEVFNKYFPKVLGDLRKLKQQPVEERESG